jgi:hypothetical protein
MLEEVLQDMLPASAADPPDAIATKAKMVSATIVAHRQQYGWAGDPTLLVDKQTASRSRGASVSSAPASNIRPAGEKSTVRPRIV